MSSDSVRRSSSNKDLYSWPTSSLWRVSFTWFTRKCITAFGTLQSQKNCCFRSIQNQVCSRLKNPQCVPAATHNLGSNYQESTTTINKNSLSSKCSILCNLKAVEFLPNRMAALERTWIYTVGKIFTWVLTKSHHHTNTLPGSGDINRGSKTELVHLMLFHQSDNKNTDGGCSRLRNKICWLRQPRWLILSSSILLLE